MLHDLYLLSCYFEPTNAVLYEDDLRRRYGVQAVRNAVVNGFVELYCAPCASAPGKFFCRLSARGRAQVEMVSV